MKQEDWFETWKEFAEVTDKATEAIRRFCQVMQDLEDEKKKKAQWWRKENKFKIKGVNK